MIKIHLYIISPEMMIFSEIGNYAICAMGRKNTCFGLNPFNPEFTIVIFIHYKPQIAVAILDL